jgi:lipopolysaccharide export system protein LptA
MRLSGAVFLAALALTAAAARAERLTLEADSSSLSKENNRTILVGNAVLRTEDTKIKADRMEIFGPDRRYAVCTGRVSFVDTKKGISITTEKLEYDRESKRSRMQGPTVMEDKSNKVVIKGSFIEDDGKTEITVIQINVRILKDDMVCRSEYAYYRRKEKFLELTGLPLVVKGGNEYRASRITVDLETDDIVMDGSFKGTMEQGKASPSPSPVPAEGSSTPEPSPSPGEPRIEPTGSPSPGEPAKP